MNRLTLTLLFAIVLGSVLNLRCASEPRLEVIFLGTGGPRPDGRATSCNLILVDQTPRFFVDTGSGAFARLGELHLKADQVDTIYLTHLHIDHTADLPSFVKSRALISTHPIHFTIFGPTGDGDYPSTSRFIELLFGSGGAWAYVRHFGATVTFDGRDLPNDSDRPPFEVSETPGHLRVSAVHTHHGDAPAVAYRVDFEGRSVTFSGDIDPEGLPNLEKLAQNSNLLVFNCAVLDPPGSPEELYTRHTPPTKIGALARNAHVERLILSHIAPLVEKWKSAVLKSIQSQIDIPTSFAEDKMRVAP
jgi:ribonuclease BN (tRNA processing enzyme)